MKKNQKPMDSLDNGAEHAGSESPKVFHSQSVARQNISRRGLLKNAGLITGSGALAGLGGCGGDDNREKQSSTTCSQEVSRSARATINAVTYSADGKTIATADKSNEVKIWNAVTAELIINFTHDAAVYAVTLNANGTRVAAGGDDQVVKVWDVAGANLVTTYEGHNAKITGVAFSADGKSVLSCANERYAHKWDAQTGALIGQFTDQHSPLRSMAMHPSGNLLATVGITEPARVWNPANLQTIDKGSLGSAAPNAPISSVLLQSTITIGGSGKTVDAGLNIDIDTNYNGQGILLVELTSPAGTTVTIWDHGGTGVFAGNFPFGRNPLESLSAFNGEPFDGTWTLSITADNDGISGNLLSWSMNHAGYTANASVANFVRFGKSNHILVNNNENRILVWDYVADQLIHSFDQHAAVITALAVSPDGSKVLSCDLAKKAYLWDFDNGNVLLTYDKHVNYVSSACFSPDGTHIVTGGADQLMQKWKVADGTLVSVFYDPHTTIVDNNIFLACGSSTGVLFCSCDTVCSCDSVCSCNTVCTCDAQSGSSGGGHYWYPN